MAAVYSRELKGEVLTLSASGWTYDFLFVLYDYETETIWYALDGISGLTAISGKHADWVLAEFESAVLPWNEWKERYPGTTFLQNK